MPNDHQAMSRKQSRWCIPNSRLPEVESNRAYDCSYGVGDSSIQPDDFQPENMTKPCQPSGEAKRSPRSDQSLTAILQRCGAYYQSGELFYQQLWHQRLSQIGFRVISVAKQPYHQIWDIRLYGTLTAESYLLLSKPVAKPSRSVKDLLLKQFQIEIQQIASDLGAPIRRDHIHPDRKGAYFRVVFVWPRGRPGRWAKPEKKAEAFSFLIRPWLRRNRN